MPVNSRVISSNQEHTHAQLPKIVRRHLAQPSRKPVAGHSRAAFEGLKAAWENTQQPLVLDSFCGTGKSTAILAQRHPRHLVVGVDKSAHRLNKHTQELPQNCLLLRADCEDIWQLLHHTGMPVAFHYLLYPNPWPKSRHLQRRIHGSAGFSRLLQLGGKVELRSNWRLYVEEFGLAMHLAGYPGRVFLLPRVEPMTLFEEKYQTSNHDLWACTCDLNTRGPRDAGADLG